MSEGSVFVSDGPQTRALYRADMNSVDGEGCLLPKEASIPKCCGLLHRQPVAAGRHYRLSDGRHEGRCDLCSEWFVT